jgi:hypothetical protein
MKEQAQLEDQRMAVLRKNYVRSTKSQRNNDFVELDRKFSFLAFL